jgi:hypothetical protein
MRNSFGQSAQLLLQVRQRRRQFTRRLQINCFISDSSGRTKQKLITSFCRLKSRCPKTQLMHSSIRYFKKARSDPFGSDVSGVVGFRRTFSRLLRITEKREEMSKNQEERKKSQRPETKESSIWSTIVIFGKPFAKGLHERCLSLVDTKEHCGYDDYDVVCWRSEENGKM